MVVALGVYMPSEAWAQCAPTGFNQTCTNSTTLTGGSTGINDTGTLTVTNTSTGTISGTTQGIDAVTANVTDNSGTIQGTGANSSGIAASTIAVTANSGTISGVGLGIISSSLVIQNGITVTSNTGTIEATAANGRAIFSQTDATVTNGDGANSKIQANAAGGVAILANGNGTATVTNGTGTISGDTAAISASNVVVNGNTGSITSANGAAIAAVGDATVTNSKTIEGTTDVGIRAGNKATVNNLINGNISGATSGINATILDVTNNAGATISGGTAGIGITGGFGNVTNDGTISGNVGVSMGGTLTNSGTITGTGGTSVQFTGTGTNTLTLKQGSTLTGEAAGATGAINILQLRGIGTADNNFSHFTSLDALGGWTLNGSADVGNAQVGGSLIVGNLAHPGAVLTAAGDVSVLSGGSLSGVGTIVGNINMQDGGKLAPGLSIGTLNVTGNVTFTSGSIFLANATPTPTDVGKLAVTGTATLGGATVRVQAQTATYAPSTQYTILTAGSLSGQFNSTVTTNLVFLTPSLTYDTVNNKVVLTLTCDPGIDCGNGPGGPGGGGGGGGGTSGAGFAAVAQTANQNAVATALNGGVATNPVILAVLNQTADGARQAFDSLSGEVFGSVHNVQAGETQFARSAMLARMRQASYAGYVGELGALAFGGPELTYAGDNANGAYAADIRPAVPGKAPARTGDRSRDLTFWAQGLGGWGHTDSDGNAASVRGRFGGFLSGVDARFGETLRAGFLAGYMRSDLNADARSSSAGIDSVQIGAYASGKLGALNVRTGASYSFDSIDVSRGIFFPGFTDQTKASFHGNVGQVFGEVGYGMTLGHVAVEPLAGLAYVHVHDNSFVESGGAAALTGSSAHENIGYSFLGARVATVLPLANGTALVPRISAQWQYAFGDVTPVAGLAFQGMGTAFSVAGVPIARNAALLETGFDWRFSPQAKLGAYYQGELAAHAESHAFKGTFSWNF